MRRRPVGRPRKYVPLMAALDDDELYSPAVIARIAQGQGLLAPFLTEESNEDQVMQRIRIAMIRISNLHNFPDEGDGQVRIEGQAPVPGWFGWRWKST
ncbi:MAG: hypothetical protein GY807_00085 [Gammaproteobacteria bacterium]|nr:hypothetical protein [Gammaproteobacteria bacterium]